MATLCDLHSVMIDRQQTLFDFLIHQFRHTAGQSHPPLFPIPEPRAAAGVKREAGSYMAEACMHA